MFSVIFEVLPNNENCDDYLGHAKMLRPELLADNPRAREELKQELRLTRRVSHRNIVRTHDFGVSRGVPTGIRDLDELTNGLQAGQMIVIAARPGVGKSTLGLDIARSAAIRNHQPTCIFSLEMSKHEITMRLLSAEAKVPLHHMR